ncbi:MAG: 13E12 repeat family protein, partial [Actinomycetota bacterium]|nr:13E12 repeat family protein [Actinomycetota bacterium]
MISWAQAQQLREITSFTARCQATAQADAAARAAARAAGEPVGPEVAFCDGVEQAAAEEVALILRVAPVTAAGRVDEAITLAERHPTALTALADGELTLTKVRIIAEQTTHLPDTQAAAVERRVLA